MSMQEELPGPVVELMKCSSVAQYASVSAAGMPIDTPVLVFPSEGLRSFDLATGLSYPAKAERARRNPRTGLLIHGGPGDPVVSIAGMAAVRDADLQANVDRYLSECAFTLPHDPDWALARQAVWYWTRIIVEVVPVSVLWWDSRAAMDRSPQVWRAPAASEFPNSDPAPPGKISEPAKWQERPWRELAAQALGRNAPGHVSTIDSEGFPRPLPASAIALTGAGFELNLPAGIPWDVAGKACLTFGGIETFLGEIAAGATGCAVLTVERTLPVFPMTQDMTQLWQPAQHTRDQLMRRLREETARRGQPIPAIPAERPAPSEGYKRRLERMKAPSGAAD